MEYVQALCSHSGDEVALLPRMTQSVQSLIPKIGLLSKLAQYPHTLMLLSVSTDRAYTYRHCVRSMVQALCSHPGDDNALLPRMT